MHNRCPVKEEVQQPLGMEKPSRKKGEKKRDGEGEKKKQGEKKRERRENKWLSFCLIQKHQRGKRTYYHSGQP